MKRDNEYYIKELEKLFDGFIEDYGFSKDTFRKAILENWSTVKNYHELSDVIYNTIPRMPDEEYYGMSDEERRAYGDYRYGPFDKFYTEVTNLYLEQYGKVHTVEEVKQIAVDFWIPRIFGFHIQDNGDDTPGGAQRQLLMSGFQSMAQERNNDPEIKEKAKELIYDYFNPKNINRCCLSVDYDPCCDLYDILKEAGVKENDICTICPIKTSFMIDQRDYSIQVVDGYGNFKYL